MCGCAQHNLVQQPGDLAGWTIARLTRQHRHQRHNPLHCRGFCAARGTRSLELSFWLCNRPAWVRAPDWVLAVAHCPRRRCARKNHSSHLDAHSARAARRATADAGDSVLLHEGAHRCFVFVFRVCWCVSAPGMSTQVFEMLEGGLNVALEAAFSCAASNLG